MSDYKTLETAWNSKEKFFVSYAVRGPVFVDGTRQEMPNRGPRLNMPVTEPSPLNSGEYVPPAPGGGHAGYVGIGGTGGPSGSGCGCGK